MTLPIVTGGLTWLRSAVTYQLQTEAVFFDIFTGYNELPETRGSDDIVPGLAGRYRRNRIDDRLIIELRGWIRGVGGTTVERQQAFRASVTAIQTAFDPTGTSGTLTALAPYMGLSAGSKAITAYPMTLLSDEGANTMSFARFSIELEAIGTPPRWA
jgi:hypothetical protein